MHLKCLLLLNNTLVHPLGLEEIFLDKFTFINVKFSPSNTTFFKKIYFKTINCITFIEKSLKCVTTKPGPLLRKGYRQVWYFMNNWTGLISLLTIWLLLRRRGSTQFNFPSSMIQWQYVVTNLKKNAKCRPS